MAATYNQLLPTNRDKARALLGDTEVAPAENAHHSDEHIDAVLAFASSFEAGVAWLADELVTRYAQDPVKVSLTGLSVDFSAQIPAWQALATRMRDVAAAATVAATRVATGVSFRHRPRPDYTLAGGDVVEEA